MAMAQATTNKAMKAIVQHRYGSVETLQLEDIAQPDLRDADVMVKVHAAGVDRGVWHLMTGLPYAVRMAGYGLRAPKFPVRGADFAGRVERVGKDVTDFKAGDEVFGTSDGAYAEYVAVPSQKLALKPARVSFEQAAAVAVSACTALQALRDQGRVRKGQKVLVIGASGGVGTFAVQLARAFGAEVTGVCQTSKVELVRSIGADRVIDYTAEDFADGSVRYDLILDIGGNTSIARLRRALAHVGTLVIVGGEGKGRWLGLGRQLRAMALSPFLSQRLVVFFARVNRKDLQLLAEMMDNGTITPVVDKVFPLDQAPQAIRYLEAGKARGKLVIAI